MPCCWPATLIAATAGSPACRHADSNAAHHAAGSCSDRGGCVGGCGADPRPTTRPLSSVADLDLGGRWWTSRRRRRAPSADAGHVAGDEVLEPLLPARHAGRLAAIERPVVQRGSVLVPVEDRPPELAVPAGVAVRRGWRRARRGSAAATSSARAIVSIPPMWPWNRSVRSIDCRRSLASKFSPPVVNPPARRISSMPSAICSTDTGKRSTSQPSRSSPALASIDPKMPGVDGGGDLVGEVVARQRGVVDLDVDLDLVGEVVALQEGVHARRRRSRTGAWSARTAWARSGSRR